MRDLRPRGPRGLCGMRPLRTRGTLRGRLAARLPACAVAGGCGMTGAPGASDPVFVRSTNDYSSYADFWRLVELSGFPMVRSNQADLGIQSACYVWVEMDPDSLEHLIRLERTRASRVVWWYLERPDANPRPGIPPEEMFRQAVGEVLSWVDQVWVSDRGLQRIEPETVFAVLGSHPGLAEPAPSEERWDAVHVGQRTPRRATAIERLRTLGD